jgi:Tol biopolymer transport system component/imidazolonepropionase-like amidohydrolase
MTLKNTLLLAALLIVTIANAQEKDKWDILNPPGNYKEIEFTTDEGTWMNLDVSPDGQTIIFDMLGDIYSMPITGGTAKALRENHAFEVQPRFSPDGKTIVFTSDAGGGDNVWTMNADGSEAKQVTKESFRLLNNPVFSPDGDYIVARKHFTSGRSLGAGELWMYHKTGGSGMQITKRKNDQQDLNEPTFSPDGKYIYYSEDVYPGGSFQYNKDPNSQIFVIRRFDRETGEIETVTGGPGGAIRPQISPDGKIMAFVKRVRTESVLYLHDLESGEEWPIFRGLSKDQQEAWTIFGVYTGYNWLPDNKHLVIWGNGKFWKVNVETQKFENIPFTVNAKHRIYDAVRFRQELDNDDFDVKVIRHAVTSPDGKYLIFNAVGYLWRKDLPNGEPERILPNMTDFQFEPNFSKDGKFITFVTWDDEKGGAIYKMDASAKRATPTKLTTTQSIFRMPKFSPDGKTIVYLKEDGNMQQGFTYSKNAGIYTVSANGGAPTFVTANGENPEFSTDGKRLFYNTGGYLFGGKNKSLQSVKLDGTDEKTHFESEYTNQWSLSPDNEWLAFSELYKVYVVPFPKTGKPVNISADTKAVPIAQIAKDAGINLHWSADSKKVLWTLGDEYYSTKLTERFLFLDNAADSIPPLDTAGLKIGLNLKTDKPEGVVIFQNARIITMKGDEVIENGVLIVTGNKISYVGDGANIKLDKSAKIIDLEGKTIMPGFVDVHAHVGNFRYGLSPKKQWEYFANLAYGVTTVHDPSSNSEMIFSHAEAVKAGNMVGPRIHSTGVILYGADGDFKAVVNNLDDAKSALRRTAAYGAFSVKSYNQPRREQRQQIMEAARQLNIMVVPEGGSFFYHNMSMILDGHTGIEHNIPVAPAFNDVVQLWSNSKTGYTPTLIVNYGSVNGEYYWYQNTNVWEKERLLNFTPRAIIDSRSRHRMMLPDEEYQNGHILTSQSCKKLSDAGVKVNLGAHGQLQGLGAHWELWMLQQGGMTNMEALRAATLNGASYIGMDEQIGSLEEGKLADLIIMEKNPLENIRNSETIIYTMVNGRLYDSKTMNEIGNYDNERTQFYWEMNKYSQNFPWHERTNGFMPTQCGCRN